MSKPKPPKTFANEGQRQLWHFPPSEVASKTGLSRQKVTNWRKARHRPTIAARALLLVHYGIPVTSWDEPGPTGQDTEAAPAVRLTELTMVLVPEGPTRPPGSRAGVTLTAPIRAALSALVDAIVQEIESRSAPATHVGGGVH